MLKRKLLVFVTAVAAACGAVNAQSDEAFEEAMRKCAAIEETDARLTCFDAVASVAQPAATDAAPEAPTELKEIAATPKPAAPAAEVIERILDHLGHTAEPVDPAHSSRAPPQGDRLL